jgi:hypothetical protein
MKQKNLTYDHIRGLIDGGGCFTFHTVPNSRGNIVKKAKIPAFVLIMHERNAPLMGAIKDFLNIDKDLYHYGPRRKDGYNRGGIIKLSVRDLGTLKNTIIPLFYNNLIGYKNQQFEAWLNKMGTDPDVPEQYRLLYRLHRTGYFERNPKFMSNRVKRENTPDRENSKNPVSMR